MSQTSTQPPLKQEPVSVAYAPPKRTWRKRLAYSLRSWGRTTFSRESYITSLKSLLWVVPLTVLIWIYAEREQVTTLNNVTVSIAPPAGQPGRLLVRFAPGTPHTIHADLHAPQSSAEEAKEVLESSTITLDLERDLTPGDHTIDIANVLNRDPRVMARGAEMRNCVPAEVTVTVEGLREVAVDVRPRPEDTKGVPPLAFEPAKVNVVIPEREYTKAVADNRFYVYPNLKPFADELAQTGPHQLRNVALSPAFEDPLNAASISPVTVNATFDRPSTEVSYTIPAIAVLAAYPATSQADRLKAEYKSPIPGITVLGPEDKIKPIRDGELPYAVFAVDFSGNPQDPRQAQLIFVLPPGVKVDPKDAKGKIDYTLVPRTAAQ